MRSCNMWGVVPCRRCPKQLLLLLFATELTMEVLCLCVQLVCCLAAGGLHSGSCKKQQQTSGLASQKALQYEAWLVPIGC